MTLTGQPAAYWQGNYAAVSEANPAARWLMQIHPLLFVVAGAVSSLIVAIVILRTNRPLAVAVSLLVTFGHTVAACGWLAKNGPAGWAAALVILLLVNFAFSGQEQKGSKLDVAP